MRELKFDIIFWDCNDKETIEHLTPQEAICEDYIEFKDGLIIPTDESTIIRQFTGLHDKNGKEIYEGDILEENDLIGKVIFKQGAFQQIINGVIEDIRKTVEIIGNVYSNPELLK